MKIKGKGKENMNLRESWGKRIARDNMHNVPIITSLPKDAEKADVRVRVIGRLAHMAKTICQCNRQRFKNVGDVYRAGLYFSIIILFEMYGGEPDSKDTAYGHEVYDILKKNEKYRAMSTLLDDIVTSANDVIKAADDSIISMKSMRQELEELIEEMPGNVQKAAENRIKRLLDGSKMSDIRDNQFRGGDRKSKVYKRNNR